MKVYVVAKLQELCMDVPENDTLGVYTKKENAEKALVEWILELAETNETFRDSLLRDENHEEMNSEEFDRDAVSGYVLSEIKASGMYYVYGLDNSYHFDIFERDLSDFA